MGDEVDNANEVEAGERNGEKSCLACLPAASYMNQL
jgi:hypothetical protein